MQVILFIYFMSINFISVLREKTGAGLLDCKKALEASNNNIEEAIVWLRKKGMADAGKKAGRATAEGIAGFAIEGNKITVVELNSETDFVSRNEIFLDLFKKALSVASHANNIEELLNTQAGGVSMKDHLAETTLSLKENIVFRKLQTLNVQEGAIATYVHNTVFEGAGQIVCAISLESKAEKEALRKIGQKICMHIASAMPKFLDIANVPTEILEKEKEIYKEQSMATGKPMPVIEKMIEGRIKKFYSETVLLKQAFIMDPNSSIEDFLAQSSKELGSEIKIGNFIRMKVGEGVELEKKDFSEEVKALSGK